MPQPTGKGRPVTGTDFNDILQGFAQRIIGGDGDDELIGSGHGETIIGGDGNDRIIGNGGPDVIFGNGGIDTAVFTGSLQDAILTEGKGGRLFVETALGTAETRQLEFLEFDDFIFAVGQNNAPFTRPDHAATDEDTPLAAINVTGNDFDIEGDAVTLSLVSTTSTMGAAISVNPDGSIAYDPTSAPQLQGLDTGDTATDSFLYQLTDSEGNLSPLQVVLVDVTGITDATLIDFDEGISRTFNISYVNNLFAVRTGNYTEDGMSFGWTVEDKNSPRIFSNPPRVNPPDPVNDTAEDGNNAFYLPNDSWSGGLDRATLAYSDPGGFHILDFDVLGDDGLDENGFVIFSMTGADGSTRYTLRGADDGLDEWDLLTYEVVNGSAVLVDSLADVPLDTALAEVGELIYFTATLSINEDNRFPYDPGTGIGIDNLLIG
ncbi:VCBS domain-containing protein [Mameliella alba]|nr:VCBS domain-containing protein [Antarctobacter heliothermus]MBY6145341.1 VCBS domain-containing protein [Mameliella alba]MCA0955089.1 VCBS domain-containing protein [Mameliella alba]